MIGNDRAEQAAEAVLEDLNGRSGYDSLWDELDGDIQYEIRLRLTD